jgi:signal transduction histidine kinase
MDWSRLFPTPADERTRLAMLRQFYDLSRLSLVAASLLVALQVGFTWGRVPVWMATLWALVFGVQIAVRAVWRHQVLRLDDGALAAQERAWTLRAVWGSAFTGMLWSAALSMAFDPDRTASPMYIAMLSCVTVVASINVMAPQPRAFVALALPVLATLVALILSLDTTASLYYALVCAVGGAMAIGITFRHARLLHESHALRYEREGLLAQAQRAREAQTRFLAAASHDLRQPVHALGLLAAQVRAELDGRRAAGTAEQLQAMAVALDGLVESLLDVSRLDGGAVQTRIEPLPLQRLFDRLAPEFAVLADARELQWRLRPSELWVASDEAQLERMLRNLLSNALRYTREGGVLLAARQRGAKVEVSVWDTGPGIAPEHQERIFDEFVQLQNPGRDRSRGHGLGLAIVARVSRLLNHPVRLQSRVGRGSRFTIELPIAPAGEALVPMHGAQWGAGGEAPDPSIPGVLDGLHGLQIALVEDDDAVRDATASLLATWGCQVWADAAARPLIARLNEVGVVPERIVSDWRLAQGDGVEAIALLRRDATRRSPEAEVPLPALLLSGEVLPHTAAELDVLAITAARKPLPAAALRAWLNAPRTKADRPAPR